MTAPASWPTTGGRYRPSVAMLPWREDAWALAVQPGSDVVDLHRAVEGMPAGVELSAIHGGMDVILVYRPRANLAGRRRLVTLNGSALDMPSGFPGRSRWLSAEGQDAYRAGFTEAVTAVRLFLTRPGSDAPDGAGADLGGVFPPG